jgi:hypothetical protein
VFSSASDAPRSRRPTDLVLLALAVLTVVVLTFPAPGPTSVDSLVSGLVKDLPGLFGWFWELAYDLLIAWSLALIALALLAHGRKRLLLEELLAGGLAVGVALVAGWLAGTDVAGSSSPAEATARSSSKAISTWSSTTCEDGIEKVSSGSGIMTAWQPSFSLVRGPFS